MLNVYIGGSSMRGRNRTSGAAEQSLAFNDT